MTAYAVIVLAAGASRRFGPQNKLLARLGGRPVLGHVLDALAKLQLQRRIVVTGPQSDIAAVVPPGFDVVVNADADLGMGGSIAAGVKAVADCDAAFIALGDMPLIPASVYERLIAALEADQTCDIVQPRHQGQAGHPVLFRQTCFAGLAALTGDRGAKALIRSGRYRLAAVDLDCPAILTDIDTPADLERYSSRSA